MDDIESVLVLEDDALTWATLPDSLLPPIDRLQVCQDDRHLVEPVVHSHPLFASATPPMPGPSMFVYGARRHLILAT